MAEQPTFAELLARCQNSAVHLEMRDGYMLDDPVLHAWREGHRPDLSSPEPWWLNWHQLLQPAVERGVRVRRARVVSEPISEYIRYEYDVTSVMNIAAGELVRWLPRSNATDLLLPGNDYWVFDDHAVQVIHFNGVGTVVEREVSTDSRLIAQCQSAFEAVWERATPHKDYNPS
ncbi:DUF6879 family protein [Catellatospora sichuanensis]|uniref:DUF6879 family protein n=1 Tax=Catellatospora sichuanensis TaxID=1969805 RepID=UPI001182E08D|nr:DUF6879 family protein [Catellatospora sichuanensis]